MKIRSETIFNFKQIIILLISISFFSGFYLRENIAGGAESDFLNLTYPAIIAFKNNFYDTLLNYGKFGEGSLPLFHILNAYLNPFIENQYLFQLSITLLSLINVYLFFEIVKKKFSLKNLDALLYASLFLLLPFFRSSAYWGLTENIGWLFLLLSIKNYIDLKEKNSEIIKIFYVCFFSSLALYTRPYLIFFPIFICINCLIKKKFKFFKYATLFYSIFSIPGFYLIYLWGGPLKIGPEQSINLLDYHNPSFILKNLLIFFSIFLFYSLPLEISKISQKFLRSNSYFIKYFIFILLFLIFLDYLNFLDYIKIMKMGGGAFLKINHFIFKDNIIFFLITSSIGVLIILNYFLISNSNKVLFLSIMIFCFPKFIFQEYFEPLIIIVLFCLIDFNKKNKFLISKNKTLFIFTGYFVSYYLLSYLYRYQLS